MKSKLYVSFYRKYAFSAILVVVMLLAGIYFFRHFEISSKDKATNEQVSFIKSPENTEKEIVLSEFDPNELSKSQWQKLGFSEKQAETILKYKNIVGGSFSSKEQFSKCYVVSDEKYLELEPYLLLPENTAEKPFTYFKSSNKSLNIPGKFNPDHYTKDNWINLGFSEKQAEAILKYKNYLGGSFISKEKFRECFIISDENYLKLKPYLLLPERTPNSQNSYYKKTENTKISYTVFDPNDLDEQGWMHIGFSEKQAATIIKYRDKILKGKFNSPEDLQRCFVVSEDKFNELKSYIRINNQNVSEQVSSQKSAEQTLKTDFSKTDLNTISFQQLQEFGFDEKAAGSFIGFRKKLGGFATKDQILETYNINKELTQKLINTAFLKSDNIQKYSLTNAPEKWLKEHPYFKYYADKIIFFRITYPDDKKILKMMKLKPDTEAKMKLYLTE